MQIVKALDAFFDTLFAEPKPEQPEPPEPPKTESPITVITEYGHAVTLVANRAKVDFGGHVLFVYDKDGAAVGIFRDFTSLVAESARYRISKDKKKEKEQL